MFSGKWYGLQYFGKWFGAVAVAPVPPPPPPPIPPPIPTPVFVHGGGGMGGGGGGGGGGFWWTPIPERKRHRKFVFAQKLSTDKTKELADIVQKLKPHPENISKVTKRKDKAKKKLEEAVRRKELHQLRKTVSEHESKINYLEGIVDLLSQSNAEETEVYNQTLLKVQADLALAQNDRNILQEQISELQTTINNLETIQDQLRAAIVTAIPWAAGSVASVIAGNYFANPRRIKNKHFKRYRKEIKYGFYCTAIIFGAIGAYKFITNISDL